MKFQTYVRYRNTALLGRKEIDVIAVRFSKNERLKIVVTEAFGSLPDEDIFRKTKEMKEKLSVVTQNYQQILQEIGINYGNKTSLVSFEGWIFSHDTTIVKKLASDIQVYDIRKIKSLCKKFNVNHTEFFDFIKKRDVDFSIFS